MISSSSKRKRHRFILFVPDEYARTRLWDGGKLSADAAKRVFGADEAFPMSQLHARLAPLLSAASLVLCDADRSAGADPRYSSLVEERLFGKAGAGGGGERAAAGGGERTTTAPNAKVQGLRPHTHSLRWVKSAAELALMRRSAGMAAAGMRAAMAASHLSGTGSRGRGSRDGDGEYGNENGAAAVSERALAAAFEHEAKRRGADRLAYPPVVAGGPRACTIHYSRNDRLLRPGTWLLMDAGCEFWGYASDVSRAWPVVGSSSSSSSPSPSSASALFSSGPHSDVYHALLEVHTRCVAACVPGTSLSELHALSFSLLAEVAAQLGGAGVRDPRSAVPALRGLSAAEIAGSGGRGGGVRHGGSGSGRSSGPLLTSSGLYPHAVGHWLGLDTHDAPLAGSSNTSSSYGSGSSFGSGGSAGAALVPNVALTVEPGLYFPADEARWGRLAGVGMRLEDDVAVRAGSGLGEGPEVFSAGAPLLPADVAAAIDGSS